MRFTILLAYGAIFVKKIISGTFNKKKNAKSVRFSYIETGLDKSGYICKIQL